MHAFISSELVVVVVADCVCLFVGAMMGCSRMDEDGEGWKSVQKNGEGWGRMENDVK